MGGEIIRCLQNKIEEIHIELISRTDSNLDSMKLGTE